MKTSLTITALILLVTGIFAWTQEDGLAFARKSHDELVARALAAGIPTDGSQPTRTRKDAGEDRSTSVDQVMIAEGLDRMIAFQRKFNLPDAPAPSDEERGEAMAFYQHLMNLDSRTLLEYLDQLSRRDDCEWGEKYPILETLITALGARDPLAALNYLSDGPFPISNWSAIAGRSPAAMCLRNLGAKEPEAALGWIDRQNPRYLATEELRGAALQGALLSFPDFAINEALKLPEGQLWGFLNSFPDTPTRPVEDQKKLLAIYLREFTSSEDRYLGELSPDASPNRDAVGKFMLANLIRDLAPLPAASIETVFQGQQWTDEARTQLADLASQSPSQAAAPEFWLPFFHENLVGDPRDEAIRGVVTSWAERDFQAAADWIGQQENGSLRQQAVLAYAQTVTPHEPASAAEWAETLPDSPERQRLFRTIAETWQSNDPAAADAFAARHNLK